jgi:putative endonuclease
VGRHYEAQAAAELEARGWTIVDRNVRFGRREIDLIIRRGDVVAFVEVKARRTQRCGHPLEAITRRKRHEIECVARWWLSRFGRASDHYRFDAVAVVVDRAGTRIEHVEEAWRSGE